MDIKKLTKDDYDGTSLSDPHIEKFINTFDEMIDDINVNSVPKDVDRIIYSLSQEKQEIKYEVVGTSVFLDIQAIGGGDMHYNIDGTVRTLNCTTGDGVGGKARVEIPQGTSSIRRKSIVYVVYSEQDDGLVLATTSTSPRGAFAPVALISIYDYVTVSVIGPTAYQRATEVLSHGDDGEEKGALSWMREKLRYMPAQYLYGVDPDFTITTNAGSEDDIDIHFTAGEVFQMHRQSFPAYDITTRGLLVENASGAGALSKIIPITNLNLVHEIADGTALNDGDSIVLKIWGTQNYDSNTCQIYATLPKHKHTVDADALHESEYARLARIPKDCKTVGFDICLLVLKWNTADGGTWTNLLGDATEVWHSEPKTGIDTPNYPSNYPSNVTDSYALQHVGADKVRVHYNDFITESNYDFSSVRDGVTAFPSTISALRADPLSYSGSLGAFTSDEIDGDTIRVQFKSDGSVTRRGYNIDALEWMETILSGSGFMDIR